MYNDGRNILLIVEGADDEVNLFKKIIQCFPEISLSPDNVLVYNTNLCTITRFIKVRERLAARRQKPENLPVAPGQILIVKTATTGDMKQTAKNTLEVEKTPDSVATYNNSEKEIMEEPEKRDVAEAEAMIQKLLNSTPQQLGLEEEEARKRMKQK